MCKKELFFSHFTFIYIEYKPVFWLSEITSHKLPVLTINLLWFHPYSTMYPIPLVSIFIIITWNTWERCVIYNHGIRGSHNWYVMLYGVLWCTSSLSCLFSGCLDGARNALVPCSHLWNHKVRLGAWEGHS